eukprot:scaffold1.g5309.t1
MRGGAVGSFAVDPDFDVDLVAAKPQPSAAPPPPQPEAAARQRPQAAPRAAPAPAPPRGGSGRAGATARQVDMRRAVLAAAQASMVILAVASLQPFSRYVGWTAFFLFNRTALVASGLKLYLEAGLPRLRPFPQAAQPWLQQVAASGSLFHLMLAGLMLQNPLLWLGVVPLAITALYGATTFLDATLAPLPAYSAYGAPLHARLLGARQLALRVSAATEIALGFQAALTVFSLGFRGGMLAMLYWQQLRFRFWLPESRPYHLQVWQAFGARLAPLLAAAPAVQGVVDKAVAWFQRPGVQAGFGC